MKNKLSYLIVIFFLSIGVFANSASAYGTFELIDFPDALNAVAGKAFTKHVDFFYSGGYTSSPRISFVGSNLPSGMKMTPPILAGGSLYNSTITGTPLTPGNYDLILTLTDYDGALLNKKFTFKVDGLTFSDEVLPNAIVGKPYSHVIRYSYNGDVDPFVKLTEYPDYVQMNYSNIFGRNGEVPVGFTSWKEGRFTFNVNATSEGAYLGNKSYTVTIAKEEPFASPANAVTSKQVTAPVEAVTQKVIIEAPKKTAKVEIVEKKAAEVSAPTKPTEEVKTESTTIVATREDSAVLQPVVFESSSPQRPWYYWLNPLNWFK